MDQLRNIGTQNKSLIVNVIYIAAVAIILYYMVSYYYETSSTELSLLGNKRSAVGMTDPVPYVIHDGKTQSTRDRRIKLNGAYTFSAWFYLNTQPAAKTTLLKIAEQAIGSQTATTLLEIGLYPGANKMYVRSKTGNSNISTDIAANAATLQMCDVLDVDYQRWIQVTVVVNGRIMDVYMDGKLARSCVLPGGQGIVQVNGNSTQAATVYAFPGYYSGLYFKSEAATPDLIYARYQMGPYAKADFIDYLVDKLGIKITYAGSGGVRETIQKSDWFE